MNEKPLVSVILLTYNRVGLLPRAVASVLTQSYRNLELIVVNNGATDTTASLLGRQSDARVRVITLAENRGPARGRNAGLQQAHGAFTAFQDDDDEWLPDKLERQMAVFQHCSDRVGVVYSEFVKLFDGVREEGRVTFSQSRNGMIAREMLRANWIALPSVVVRKSFLNMVGGFDEAMAALEDWELFIRLSERCAFAYVDEPLVRVYVSPGSVSENFGALLAAREYILKKHTDVFNRYPRLLAWHSYILGSEYSKRNDRSKARYFLHQARQNDPRRLKYIGGEIIGLFLPQIFMLKGRLERSKYDKIKG